MPDREVPSPEGGRLNAFLDAAARPIAKQLNWLWDRGFRFLIVIDALVLFLTMVVITAGRFGSEWPTYPVSHYLGGFLIATAIHVTVNYFSGLYEREPRLGTRPWLPRVSLAMGIGVALDGLAAVVLDRYLMPRLNLAILGVLGTVGLTLTRHLSRSLSRQRNGPSRLLMIGTADQRAETRPYLSNAKHTLVVAEAESINFPQPLLDDCDVTDILLLNLDALTACYPQPLLAIERTGRATFQRVTARETTLGLADIRQVGGLPFTRLKIDALSSHQLRLKRGFDIVLLLLSTPAWITLILLIALYSRLLCGHDVLFRQTRIGRRGREFTIYKFRTMIRDAERDTGPVLALEDDPRIVRELAWLRRTRLDELPQIFNVIRGAMSIVGPRPERPEFVREIEKKLADYERRHQVPPGITGLAQTHSLYDTDPVHKLGFDLQYLVGWSLFQDCRIILQTILTFRAKYRRSNA